MAAIDTLLDQITDPALKSRIEKEIKKMTNKRKFGLVFEDHLPEVTPLYDVPVKEGSSVALKNGDISDVYDVVQMTETDAICISRRPGAEQRIFALNDLVSVAQFGDPIYPSLQLIDKIENAPDDSLWHTLIEADNYHALQLLEYLYPHKVDCIYIDPPYNTGARDWKYNNNYVDGNDSYRHSKWLSLMEKRLKLAKKLLNPNNSVLIVTIDEKEYLHLGMLLEQLFPEANMQMVSDNINPAGVSRKTQFSRCDEYIYYLFLGNACPAQQHLNNEWLGGVSNTVKGKLHWNALIRTGTHTAREDSKNQFYPIFVYKDGHAIHSVGSSYYGKNREEIIAPEGTVAIWPIRQDGTEGNWQVSSENLCNLIQLGYVRLGRFSERGMALSYLKKGEQQKVNDGLFPVIGKRDDGSIIVDDSEYEPKYIPSTQWRISTHDASRFGTNLIASILGDKRFTFPKSLYSEQDAISFAVADKKDAIVIDFFAGSGTTLHAVNLLNAEDGGHRRCIMVTNNEVSETEAKTLLKKGLHPGDDEWDKYGIARYVTWPRTVCSIKGYDMNGKPLKGNYIGSDIPMAEGFQTNVVYFKLGFLDKTSVALGKQFCEILPILWMKAGCVGQCPEIDRKTIPSMMILPQNNMAILTKESHYAQFMERINEHPNIKTIFFITDSESSYQMMTSNIHGKYTYQLYRDYLDNFRINGRTF